MWAEPMSPYKYWLSGYFMRVKIHQGIKFKDTKLITPSLQMLYQIFGTYYEDNCADELRHDPVLSAVLGKEVLASQPTLSRFFNRMDEDTLRQFDDIMCQLRKKIYSIRMPQSVLFDIDTTLLPTYGKQEGEGFSIRISIS